MVEELELQVGPGGWVAAVLSSGDRFSLFYVRMRRRPNGDWVPHGALYIPGVGPDVLRTLPLQRVVLAVGASAPLQGELAGRLHDDVPEPESVEFERAFAAWVHEEPLTLERPSGHRLTREFYEQVANVYRAATARGLHPRAAIAELAGVSSDVAGRWVREARKRELLPATTPGRVKA